MNNKLVFFVVVSMAIAMVAARPQLFSATGTGTGLASGTAVRPNRPNLFANRPAVLANPALVSPFGSGSGSGAGTATANEGGVSASGVGISSATNGGVGTGSGTGAANIDFSTGAASATGTGTGSSAGK